MRTTLTLDDDVTIQLSRLREDRKLSLKAAVNDAIRAGLTQMLAPAPATRKIRQTPVFHASQCLIGGLVSTSDMLAVAEGDDHR